MHADCCAEVNEFSLGAGLCDNTSACPIGGNLLICCLKFSFILVSRCDSPKPAVKLLPKLRSSNCLGAAPGWAWTLQTAVSLLGCYEPTSSSLLLVLSSSSLTVMLKLSSDSLAHASCIKVCSWKKLANFHKSFWSPSNSRQTWTRFFSPAHTTLCVTSALH